MSFYAAKVFVSSIKYVMESEWELMRTQWDIPSDSGKRQEKGTNVLINRW